LTEDVRDLLTLNVSTPNATRKSSDKLRLSKRRASVRQKKTEANKPKNSVENKTNIVSAIPVAAAYDVEEAQNVVFKPNPGPQTDFLAATERQVLFGGAAGGKVNMLSIATFSW
jgi:hypothetical protein